MRGPHRHVGGVRRVADVNRVVQDDAGVVQVLEPATYPVEAVPADCVQIGEDDPGRLDLGEGQAGQPDSVPVVGHGTVILIGCATSRPDAPADA